MLYNISDKSAVIIKIKRYLYLIGEKRFTNIPHVSISGVFDRETTLAVKAFQTNVNLSPSGKVDYITFSRLFEEYRDILSEGEDDYILENTEFPILYGTQGENVRSVNMLINELSKKFFGFSAVGTGNFYSEATAEAIKELNAIFGFEKNEHLEQKTYSRMLRELDSIRWDEKNAIK